LKLAYFKSPTAVSLSIQANGLDTLHITEYGLLECTPLRETNVV